MLAGWYEKIGPAAEVIEIGQMAAPEAGPGEVRVRLSASGVNPSDVKRRAGWRGQSIAYRRIIPHSDGAGVIDRVGAGVPPARLGERVWVYNGQWQRPLGTAAEYIALPASQAVRLPDGLGFVEGACLGIPAMTAHRCVFADGPVAGQTVLVTGGAGAVGHYAVQLARWGGATVIATVSSEGKAAHAGAAGAQHVINYKSEDVASRVRECTGGGGVDRIVEVDFGANLAVSQAVLKPHGVIAGYASMSVPEPALPFYRLMGMNATIRLVFVYELPASAMAQACSDITRWLQSGTARHLIAARFPLAELARAHEVVEGGRQVGNVVIDIGGGG
jgi:NADPH2:quinone reductase